jgi:hypothetical protein
MRMARNFESGLSLVERCRHELPLLARSLALGSPGRVALDELIEAAKRAEDALRWRAATSTAAGDHHAL